MFEGKVLLIVGGGIMQVPAVRRAKELGLTVIVSDYNPSAPAVPLADFFVKASTLNAKETLDEVVKLLDREGLKLDGVLTVGTDASFTVAVISEKFGLTGISPEVAFRCTNKSAMREALKNAGVPVSKFFSVSNELDAVNSFEKLGGVVVVKPADSMGARGVRACETEEEVVEAFRKAKQFSRSGIVVVEEYIEGDELSIDSIVWNGETTITGIADRIIEFYPYFVETGHIIPSSKPDSVLREAVEVFKKGVNALGITVGAAKGDVKVSDKGVFIGEIAARLSGGFMSGWTYPYSSGVDLMEAVIRIALGFPPQDLTPKKKMFVVERSIVAPPGKIIRISGLDKAKRSAGVKELFFDAREGDVVYSPTNNLEKAGHIIVVGRTKKTAIKRSNKAVEKIHIETTPVEKVDWKKVNETARKKFNKTCYVCRVCDGRACRGQIPGVGGIGNGESFIENYEALKRVKIKPHYIHDIVSADTQTELFGVKLKAPLFAAPITGTKTNMGGAMSELEYARAVVKGCRYAGVMAMVGDGATPTKYLIEVQAGFENYGRAIAIFKPRRNEEVIKRIRYAEEYGLVAVGIDVDAAAFLTMKLKNQPTEPKDYRKLRQLVSSTSLPFVVKGIMTKEDAKLVLDAGVSGIIVSNHGGRVMDSLPAGITVLPEVVEETGGKVPVLVDGGFRSGEDVFKAIALGADGVVIGRPVMIAAVGGGTEAVRDYFESITQHLRETMILTGSKNLKSITPDKIILP